MMINRRMTMQPVFRFRSLKSATWFAALLVMMSGTGFHVLAQAPPEQTQIAELSDKDEGVRLRALSSLKANQRAIASALVKLTEAAMQRGDLREDGVTHVGILALGATRNTEVVPFLVKHFNFALDPKSLKAGDQRHWSYVYPCLSVLVLDFAWASVDPLLKHVETNPLPAGDQKLIAQAIKDICGAERGRQIISVYQRSAREGDRKERLKLLLTYFQE
jgi:hypothetical protein